MLMQHRELRLERIIFLKLCDLQYQHPVNSTNEAQGVRQDNSSDREPPSTIHIGTSCMAGQTWAYLVVES